MSPVLNLGIQMMPLLDSIAALYLFKQEGEKKYPGASTAQVVLMSTGTFDTIERKTWQQHRQEGTELIGTGGSPFDEHPSPDFGDRKKTGESAMSLVAKDLGIMNDARYRLLIDIVTQGDLKGTEVDRIASRVKSMHRQNRDNPMKAIDWAIDALHSIVLDQTELVKARKEVGKAQIAEVMLWDRRYKIGTIVSDNYMIGLASREQGFSAMIQQNTDGHTFVFTRLKDKPIMDDVAGSFRYTELKLRNQPIPEVLDLRVPGQMKEVPNWCFQQPGENMLNGSERAPDLEPTKIPLEKIGELVKKHIRFGRPDPENDGSQQGSSRRTADTRR